MKTCLALIFLLAAARPFVRGDKSLTPLPTTTTTTTTPTTTTTTTTTTPPGVVEEAPPEMVLPPDEILSLDKSEVCVHAGIVVVSQKLESVENIFAVEVWNMHGLPDELSALAACLYRPRGWDRAFPKNHQLIVEKYEGSVNTAVFRRLSVADQDAVLQRSRTRRYDAAKPLSPPPKEAQTYRLSPPPFRRDPFYPPPPPPAFGRFRSFPDASPPYYAPSWNQPPPFYYPPFHPYQ